jgi:hypothetical protein
MSLDIDRAGVPDQGVLGELGRLGDSMAPLATTSRRVEADERVRAVVVREATIQDGSRCLEKELGHAQAGGKGWTVTVRKDQGE